MVMTALSEAIERKRQLETQIRETLEQFSESTGLRVCSASIEPLETTNFTSKHKEWGHYSVSLEIDIP